MKTIKQLEQDRKDLLRVIKKIKQVYLKEQREYIRIEKELDKQNDRVTAIENHLDNLREKYLLIGDRIEARL